MQAVMLSNIFHRCTDLMKKGSGLTLGTVAIGIEKQVEFDFLIAQPLKGLTLQILQFPRGIPAALQLIGSSVGKITPGKVDFVDMRLVLADTLQQIPVSIF